MSSTSYPQLLRELGVLGSTDAPLPWLGVEIRDNEAEILGSLLRHQPETIKNTQLPVERSPTPAKVTHPNRYRACAECQIKDGGWRRWNADPLHVVCPIHQTLMWDEGPHQQRLGGRGFFNNAHTWDWERVPTQTPIPQLAKLQTQLRQERRVNHDIEQLFARLITAHRRAIAHSPEAPELAEWNTEGRSILKAANRKLSDSEQRERLTQKASIWSGVEDLVSIFPTAVPAVIAEAQGQRSDYETMLDDFHELGPMKPMHNASVATYAGAVLS